MSEQCIWTPMDAAYMSWESACGFWIDFDEAFPDNNGFEYCPRCGKKIVIETEDGGDACPTK